MNGIIGGRRIGYGLIEICHSDIERGFMIMKKRISKFLAILVVITLLPLGAINASAIPNRPLPPVGGESRIVWHHHGWGIGMIEVFLSNIALII